MSDGQSDGAANDELLRRVIVESEKLAAAVAAAHTGHRGWKVADIAIVDEINRSFRIAGVPFRVLRGEP